MIYENSEYKDSFLNDINITSNIRSPDEFKYFYCGENNSENDKSFLVFSTMWHSERITENMEIISSCYNSINTAQLFLNKKTYFYNLYIYKNIIDYKNENMNLKLYRIINISTKIKLDNQNNDIKTSTTTKKGYLDLINTKIYFASNNYILLNEFDCRILLIDINNNSYITLVNNNSERSEVLYNIFDTYDETFLINGEQKIRTYAFLSLKYQNRKVPIYKYYYFIIKMHYFKKIHLYPINLDLGNSEPLNFKIVKIIHKQTKYGDKKYFFILCFLSTSLCLQLITDYENLTLHQLFQHYFKLYSIREEKDNNNINNKYIKRVK